MNEDINVFYCAYCQKERRPYTDVEEYTCPICYHKCSFSYRDDEKRRLYIRQKQMEQNNNFNSSKPMVSCPYCQSRNCSKIGAIGRSISFGLFGFGSSKIGKQWHCKNCNSDF